MSISSSKVYCIMGPTASGKSHLAMEIAERFPCEIISVDSVMVYRGMDIGSAKPSLADQEKVPHHLIDIRDPSERYSAAEFAKDAAEKIKEICSRHKIPLLVGGTMLYYKALQQGLSQLPSADESVRKKMIESVNGDWTLLHERLQQVDPKAAEAIHPNDPQRLIRALEVYEITQQPMTVLFDQNPSILERLDDIEFVNVALSPEDRSVLHEKIEQRFDEMLAQGFLGEVEKLYVRKDLNADLPAIRAVGYRQAWEYLSGEYDLETMREKAIVATRQLAKRQLTWLRSWPNVHWMTAPDPDWFKF